MKVFKSESHYQSTFKTELMSTIVWAQLFAFYCVVLLFVEEPSEEQIFWADPILKIAPVQVSTIVTLVLSFLIGACALRHIGIAGLVRHTRNKRLAAGVLTAIIVACTIRFLVGDTLPDFVPAEESSKPGFLLSMVAGYGEEVYFRMVLAPLVFFGMLRLSQNTPSSERRVWISASTAIVVTALAFVLAHELGETDGVIVWKLVATRVMLPGIAMGVLYFAVSPGFVIFMHSSMHILIPLLFN